jgi:DNA repair protein RecO (recombination protein O)
MLARENGGVSLYRDEGVVLRTQKLGEADRIVTVLTRNHGRVRAVGKGVRRTTSKFGARLEPFSHIDVQFYAGRSLDIVTQVESLAAYGADIADDYPRYTAGTAMLETAERLTDAEKEPSVQQFLLLVGGLRALASDSHVPGAVLDSYLLRSLAVAGYAASFDTCTRCGKPGPHRWLSVEAGGSVCSDDRPPASVTVSAEALSVLSALLTGEWEIVDGAEPRHLRESTGIVAAYTQWHLERGLRSLRLVDRA